MDVSRLSPFYHTGPVEVAQAIAAADLGETSVAEILAHTGSPKQREAISFLVLWTDGDITWEPWKTVRRLTELNIYIMSHPEAKLDALLTPADKGARKKKSQV
jgi:hypothetical protein